MVEYWFPKPNARGSSPLFPAGVWPSGKASVFGVDIIGSNPFTPVNNVNEKVKHF